MSAQRRHKPSQDEKDKATSENSKPAVRPAWRSNWAGDTQIIPQQRTFSTLAGICLILYYSVFALLRFEKPGDLTALLYWSNSAVALGGFGLLAHSGLLIGLSIALVSASHMTFIYDLVVWLLFDRFPLGRAAYLEEGGESLAWLTTLHQFWFLPLMLCVIYCEYSGQLRLMKRYWAFGCLLNLLLSILAKTHFEETRLVLGSPFVFVPDFVIGHELWTSELTLLHGYDHLPVVVYAIWSWLLGAVLLNGVCYIFLQLLFFLALEGHGVIIKEKTT